MRQDQLDFRDRFREVAARYRERNRWLLFALIPLFAGFALLMILCGTGSRRAPHPPYVPLPFNSGFLFIGWFAVMVFLVVSAQFWVPTLACPNCGENMDRTRNMKYCPECGEDRVERRFWLGPICRACDKRLVRGKGGRSYKIRYCPGCGAHVDDVGV